MEQLQDVERFIQEGDVDALSNLLDQLLQSTDFDQLYEIASLLFAYGFMEEADRIYEMLLVHLPEEAQLKIDRASTLIEIGKEDDALNLLSEVQSTDDEYVQALMVLGDYYQMTGLTETALSKIKEAFNLLPDEPVIQFAYAELLLESGRYSEAARHYLALREQVAEIGDVSITSRLAETYSAGAAYEEAIPYYEEMLKDKSLPDTLFGTAFAYYQIGKSERTIKLLEELLSIDPDYYSAYMLAGQAKLQAGNDEEAYATFTNGITRDEYDKELQLSAGKCALKLGRPEVAERHLKEALVLDPEYIEAIISLASLYHENERDEDLIDLLAYSKDEIEEISLLHALLAYAYERNDQYEEAYESFNKAYSGMKDDHAFLSAYANFLVEEGKRSEAIEVVNQLVELFPEDEDWRVFLEAQNDEGV